MFFALFLSTAVAAQSTPKKYIVSQKFSTSDCSGIPFFESVIDTTKCYPYETSCNLRPKNTCSVYDSQKPSYKFECVNDGSRASDYTDHRHSSLTCGSGLSTSFSQSTSFYPSCTLVDGLWIKSYCADQSNAKNLDVLFNSTVQTQAPSTNPILDNVTPKNLKAKNNAAMNLQYTTTLMGLMAVLFLI